MRPRRRVIIVKRGAGWLARTITAVLILGLAGLWVLTQTDFGRNKIRLYGLGQLADRIHGIVRIGEVHGDLLTGATLVDVVITDSAGAPFLRADTLQLRYSRKALFQKHIVFEDVRMVRPVLVFDQPPGGEWNVERLFQGDTTVTQGDTIPGWGDWVRFEGVTVVDGDVTVRRAWSPSDDASDAERERLIDQALAPEGRQAIERVAGGFQAVSSFHEVFGSFPVIRFADPDSASRIVDVDSLSMVALPFRPPAAEVKNLTGRLVIGADSIGLDGVLVQLPSSKLRIDGVLAFGDGTGGEVRFQGDPIALADMRFLRPSLPEGGGRADFTIGQNETGTRLVARTLDLGVEGATLKGSLDAEMLETGVRVRASDLAFDELDTRTIERLSGIDPPIDGVLAGHMKLAGVRDDLTLDGWTEVRDRGGAVSRVTANGGITTGRHASVAHDLRLRFEPLRLSLLRQAGAELPVGGTLTGTATVDGPLSAMMSVNADLVHEEPAAGRSRVRARGELKALNGIAARRLRLDFDPLQSRLVKLVSPTFPLGGTFRGSTTVTGEIDSWIAVDGDVIHEQAGIGRSRVLAVGEVRGGKVAEARRLRLRFDPLQAGVVREFVDNFPPDGVIAGTATVTGTAASLASVIDLTHQGSTGTSAVAGDVRLTTRNRVVTYDVNVRARPLALATVALFAPRSGLRGSVSGPITARGTTAATTFDAALDVTGGGRIVASGRAGLGATAQYDVVASLTRFDASAITARAPSTALTGAVMARGVGTDPATMTGIVDAALVDSRVEGGPALDSTRVRARFDTGLLTVERGDVRLAGTRADIEGSFGLTAQTSGELRYRISTDSLAQFRAQLREYLPPPADSGFVVPRPMQRARELGRARADSARIANENIVERVATGSPAARELPLDTAPPIRRDSISGAIEAEGTLTGNVKRFDARGTADLDNVVYNGNFVGTGRVDYAIANAPSAQMSVELDARLATVRAGGFAFDSASATVRHEGGRREGSGNLDVAIFQDRGRDYRLTTEYTLALDRQELRLRELVMRFDSTRWSSTQPGVVRWAGSGFELENIELSNGRGGRVFADGRLPTDGSGDLRLRIDSLQIADFAALLQDTVVTRGLLSIDGTFHGTTRAPVLAGTLSLDSAARAGQPLPTLRGTFDYADARLSGHFEALDGARRLLTADGFLPVNLAFEGVTGPRLQDGAVSLDVQLDSFPLETLPQVSPEVENLGGRVRGTVTVRGTRSSPELGGQLALAGLSADLPTAGLNLRDGGGLLRFADDTLHVDSLRASSGGGPIDVNGTIALATLTEPVLDLSVEARGAQLLANEKGDVEGDASLTIGGTLDGLRVIGDVHVTGGVIAVPEPQSMQRATRLDDPQLVGVYESLGVPPALRPRNRILESTELAVSVAIDRDTWLRNSVMNVEVYTPDEPMRVTIDHAKRAYAFEGVIHADRGDYTFAGRTFKLSTGSVTFLPEQSDPILQLSARHEVPRRTREALVILVSIGGTLEQPKVSLSSNVQPPVAESDLLSYLAFGRESSSLLTAEGSGVAGDALGGLGILAEQQLAGLGLGAVIQTFVSNIESEGLDAGLDVFRVRPRAVPDELNFQGYFKSLVRTLEIEAGEYLTPRLFAAVEGNVGTQGLPGLRLEYITPRGFSWVTTWQNQFMPAKPTLDELTAETERVFGSFITWQKRF